MQEIKNIIMIMSSDPQFQKLMAAVLGPTNVKIIACKAGKEAARPSILAGIDLVLLDLTLTDMEGTTVITAIRKYSQIPIIALSTHASDDDITNALHMGADDCVIRPFSNRVLLARIYAALRKSAVKEAGALEIKNGSLRIDLVQHKVFLDDEPLYFTPKEYDLLRYFLVHRGQMLTHKQILQEVWGVVHGEETQYLRVYVGQVRAKIQKHSAMPDLIVAQPGVGYRMEVSDVIALHQPGKTLVETDGSRRLPGAGEARA